MYNRSVTGLEHGSLSGEEIRAVPGDEYGSVGTVEQLANLGRGHVRGDLHWSADGLKALLYQVGG